MTPIPRGRVLIVEDDEAAAELERRALQRAGWGVAVVGRVGEAIQALSREIFDAVLLDYNLPDGESWSVVEAAHAQTPRLPVVLITAAGSEPIVAQALQRGVGDYIRKSDRYLDDLPRVFDRVCGLARAEEALRRSGHLFKLLADHGEDMILTLDERGIIRYVSAACRTLLAYEMTDLVGTPVDNLIHPDDDSATIFRHPDGRARAAHSEIYRLRHREGHYLWVESNLQHVVDGDPPRRETIAITRDITARIAAQQKVEAALVEKTVLLNEVHHRVKNNLQIIVSLLKLQRESASDARVSAALLESESRIRAMSLIHQFLYEQRNFARLDLAAYLRQLGKLVESTHDGAARGIELQVHGPATAVWLDFEQAVPCGLLVNELLTNAYKHAFPDGRRGRIVVEVFSDEGDGIAMIVRDTGVGMPHDIDVRDASTLGLQLANLLVEQLGGRWKIDRAVQGARFEAQLPARGRHLRAVA